MIQALVTMTALGVGFGAILGVAARRFHVEKPPIVDEIERVLPGTNCGQCGFAGCNGAAEAVADGSAPITLCPPGGQEVVLSLAEITGTPPPSASAPEAGEPVEIQVAFIFEDHCTGCTKCFKRCPTDAIVGAAKQIHAVINDACTGCDACVEVCPTEAIILRPKPRNLRNWHWPKPDNGSGVAVQGERV